MDRYLLLEFLKFFLISTLALTFVFFIADYLRGVWDSNVSPLVILKYQMYQVPQIIVQMIPPSAMLGTTISLSLLNRKNELTAMHAAGVSLVRISTVLFCAILILCCLSLIFQDRVLPPLSKEKTLYYWKVIKNRQDFTLDIRTSKIWYRSKNYIYNLRTYDKSTATINGIGIYYFDPSFRLVQHIEALRAKYNETDKEWLLFDGMVSVFPEKSPFPLSKHFDEKKLSLPETPKDFLEIEKQVETLRLKDLRNFIERNKEAGLSTKIYEVDFHSRIAMSFIALIMGLIAIPYSVRPKRQGGLGKDISTSVGWIFIYWIIFSISVSIGKAGSIEPWIAVWTPCIVFLFIAVGLVLRGRTT